MNRTSRYSFILLLVFLLIVPFRAGFAYYPSEIKINQHSRAGECKYAVLTNLLKQHLSLFIYDHGGIKNKNFDKFFVKNALVFPKPIENYFDIKSISAKILPSLKGLKFSAKISISSFKDVEYSNTYPLHGWEIIRQINDLYGITEEELKPFPLFREKVLEIMAPASLTRYLEKSKAEIRKDAIYISFSVKKDLPHVLSQQKITPSTLRIITKFRGAGVSRKKLPALIQPFKTGMTGQLLKLKIQPVSSKKHALYTVVCTLSPPYKQNISSIIQRYSKKKSAFKSYRTSADIHLLKNGKSVLMKRITKAGMHISDREARLSSIERTAFAATKTVLQYIITDIYRLK